MEYRSNLFPVYHMIADCSNMYQILHNLNRWVIRTFEILIIRICMDVEIKIYKRLRYNKSEMDSFKYICINMFMFNCVIRNIFVLFTYC